MPTLSTNSGAFKWTMEARGTKGDKELTWITFLVEFRDAGDVLLSESVLLTRDDVDDLCRLLRTARETFEIFESTDADFRVVREPLESDDAVALSIWLGEPYVYMRGLRFAVPLQVLGEFATQLAEATERLFSQ